MLGLGLLDIAGTISCAAHQWVLETIVKGPNNQSDLRRPNIGYEVAELLGMTLRGDSVDRSRVALLEWSLLPRLHPFRAPEILEEMLAAEPSLFVSMLEIVCRGKNEEHTEFLEDIQSRALQGHEFLEKWRRTPGQGTDGQLDEAQLRAWVAKVRELAAAAGRGEPAERHIARLLARLTDGKDGARGRARNHRMHRERSVRYLDSYGRLHHARDGSTCAR